MDIKKGPSEMSDSFEFSESVDEIENGLKTEQVLNRLTTMVRNQYSTYLEKLLRENYEIWSTQKFGFAEAVADDWFQKCAALYEEKALKSCMIVQFYRKSMLKIIANIRRDSLHGKLAQKFEDLKENKDAMKSSVKINLVDASTQTLDMPDQRIDKYRGTPERFMEETPGTENNGLSLEDKIRNFQSTLNAEESDLEEETAAQNKLISNGHKRKRSGSFEKFAKHLRREPSPAASPMNANPEDDNPGKQSDEEDEIDKEMEQLFGKEKDVIDDIFGEGIYDPQIDKILKEIEQAKLPQNQNRKVQEPTAKKPPDKVRTEQTPPIAVANKAPPNDESVLFDSIWPCELHMQKMRLREMLSEVADRGIQHHELVKQRFNEIFGEDSDDEFGVYSPSMELNDILIASCKKRIAPWIVKHLMVPMKEGLIANRHLFKKLAKRLALGIVIDNQYPDEQYIKSTVDDFFCFRQTIHCEEDIYKS